jgi:hypothetical protein
MFAKHQGVLLRLSFVISFVFSVFPTYIVHGSDRLQEISPLADSTPPIITIWYGDYQEFGKQGTPQQWINILGNVADKETGVSSLTYTLNGGPSSPKLSLGPNKRRLADLGDFNVEIDKDELRYGTNTLVLTARNGEGLTSTKSVTVFYNSTSKWPLPYTINWSQVSNIQDAVQIVDGKWIKTANGLRTTQIAYDRVVAIGDMGWKDYEVTVPITIHGIDTSAFTSDQSGRAAMVGLMLRWLGHTDNPPNCTLPRCGWLPNGGHLRYSWRATPPDLLRITATPPDGDVSTTSRPMSVGRTYWFKGRVETNNLGSLYSLKVWENGAESEPVDWTIYKQTDKGNLANGSFLLVAHHVDATFGNVSVTPIGGSTSYSLTVNTNGSGSVTKNPNKTSYQPGEVVTLTANPASGWQFTGWSGGLSGLSNPASVTMNGNTTITANFVRVAEPGSNRVFIPMLSK